MWYILVCLHGIASDAYTWMEINYWMADSRRVRHRRVVSFCTSNQSIAYSPFANIAYTLFFAENEQPEGERLYEQVECIPRIRFISKSYSWEFYFSVKFLTRINDGLNKVQKKREEN